MSSSAGDSPARLEPSSLLFQSLSVAALSDRTYPFTDALHAGLLQPRLQTVLLFHRHQLEPLHSRRAASSAYTPGCSLVPSLWYKDLRRMLSSALSTLRSSPMAVPLPFLMVISTKDAFQEQDCHCSVLPSDEPRLR